MMKIKKNLIKTMCAALTCTAIMGNVMASYATGAIITETPMDENIGGGGRN